MHRAHAITPLMLIYSTVQYSTAQYSTAQYSAVQYSTVQHSAAQYSTVQHASGVLGGRFERTFLDVRVFNPYAPSPLVTTVMNKKSGGATTEGSEKWSGRLFCRLFSLPPEAAARVQLRC